MVVDGMEMPATMPTGRQSPRLPPEKKKCKGILIVEDNQAIRDVLEDALVSEGYVVETAANGKVALEKLTRLREPTLVLLDLMMPVMNGWDFIAAQKAAEKANRVLAGNQIMVMSAVADQKTGREPAPPAGAVEVIMKPISLNKLLSRVREYCDLPNA